MEEPCVASVRAVGFGTLSGASSETSTTNTAAAVAATPHLPGNPMGTAAPADDGEQDEHQDSPPTSEASTLAQPEVDAEAIAAAAAAGIDPLVPEYQFGEAHSVPVFRPTMAQFRDFSAFIAAAEPFGRRAGLIKVVPPPEWRRECVTDISEKLALFRIKSPIKQEFTHSGLPSGAYRQTNYGQNKNFSG
ncbi:hypothetical protein HK405_001492 [Cladochytrium tenue]|nr:hypothetical protein HK405_001492 [Cladochytrium tenue]